jgi:hypothetical protein
MTAPAYAEAAGRLLSAGAEGGAETEAAARVCRALVEFLTRFIGAAGARALFRRSLVVTRRAHPWLAAPALTHDEAGWARLSASLAAHAPAAGDASVALVGELLRLLATFVGADLAQQILHQHRPEVFPLDAPREST